MVKRYIGKYGSFDYDDKEFELRGDFLVYMGSAIDGSKIKIPEGITNCSWMFAGDNIITPPIIPEGVTNCEGMFSNCVLLKKAPVIPESVKTCTGMFYGCDSLEKPPVIPNGVENCYYMFKACTSLKTVPVISVNSHYYYEVYAECTALRNYVLSPVKLISNMYQQCPPMIQEIHNFLINVQEKTEKHE